MSVVLITGTFNLLHPGHVQLIEYGSTFGKVIVGINSQDYLVRKYGDLAVAEEHRVYILNAIRWVSNVVVFPEEHPGYLIERLQPDYYVRGPDYADTILPEADHIARANTQLVIFPGNKIYNGSELKHILAVDKPKSIRS